MFKNMDLDKVWLVDTTTGKAIPYDGIKEISETDILCDEETVATGSFECSGSISCELSSAIDYLEDALKEEYGEPKVKSNPVYVPKHIARRRKW